VERVKISFGVVGNAKIIMLSSTGSFNFSICTIIQEVTNPISLTLFSISNGCGYFYNSSIENIILQNSGYSLFVGVPEYLYFNNCVISNIKTSVFTGSNASLIHINSASQNTNVFVNNTKIDTINAYGSAYGLIYFSTPASATPDSSQMVIEASLFNSINGSSSVNGIIYVSGGGKFNSSRTNYTNIRDFGCAGIYTTINTAYFGKTLFFDIQNYRRSIINAPQPNTGLSLVQCKFSNLRFLNGGGAVNVKGCRITILNTVFYNISTLSGSTYAGALYVFSAAPVVIQNTDFTMINQTNYGLVCFIYIFVWIRFVLDKCECFS
jgi:hypothetical protein